MNSESAPGSRRSALAFKVARIGDLPRFDFAYCACPSLADRRGEARRRTRLRSGKVLDETNAFLAECQVYDRSLHGVRLRLLTAIPAVSRLRLYEDSPERLIEARIVWRRRHEIGLQIAAAPPPPKIDAIDLLALRRRYYAIIP